MSRRRSIRFGGLTPAELQALSIIHHEGPISTREVREQAKIVGIGRATDPATLARRGLVADLDEDGTSRREWVTTAAGDEVMERAAAEIADADRAGALDDLASRHGYAWYQFTMMIEHIRPDVLRPANRVEYSEIVRPDGVVQITLKPRLRRSREGPSRHPRGRCTRRWTKKEKEGCGCLVIILACVLTAMCAR